MSLTARLAACLMAVLAVVACALYVRVLRAELADAGRQLAGAKADIGQRDGVIRRLGQAEKDRAAQQAQLDHTNGAIAVKLAAAQQDNRRLLHENAALRAWADTPLPDDVVRLHAGPALTGARDYLEHVPAGESVHAAGDGPTDQR